MDETLDYAAVSNSVRQQLALLFSNNYWAKKEPVNVEELLAAAAGVNLKSAKKTNSGTTSEGQQPQSAEQAQEGKEKPVWENFLKQPEAKPDNEEIDSQL